MSAAELATKLAELQYCLARVVGAEQRALELAGNYRAMSAEQDSPQAREQYLTASVQQRLMAEGYAKQGAALNAEIQCTLDEIADAATTAHDNALFLSRIAAGHAGMDDMGGIAA